MYYSYSYGSLVLQQSLTSSWVTGVRLYLPLVWPKLLKLPHEAVPTLLVESVVVSHRIVCKNTTYFKLSINTPSLSLAECSSMSDPSSPRCIWWDTLAYISIRSEQELVKQKEIITQITILSIQIFSYSYICSLMHNYHLHPVGK